MFTCIYHSQIWIRAKFHLTLNPFIIQAALSRPYHSLFGIRSELGRNHKVVSPKPSHEVPELKAEGFTLQRCRGVYVQSGFVCIRVHTEVSTWWENMGYTLPWCHNECDGVSNHQPHNCLFKAQIKENMNAPRHWPFWGEFTGDRRSPRTKASNAENVPFDDVIMNWCG